MRWRLGIIAVLALDLAVGSHSVARGGDFDYSALLNQLSPAVVAVHALIDPDQGLWADGSGFIVDTSGKVITACHAILGAFKVVVETQNGKDYDAAIERCTDQDVEAKLYDVAVLQLQGPVAGLARAWLADPKSMHLGEGVLALSFPGPYEEFTVVSGEISSRLARQYLTVGSDVYRLAVLIHAQLQWDNAQKESGDVEDTGDILDLEGSHPRLADVEAFATPDTIIVAAAEPRDDNTFCGVVSSPAQTKLRVDEVDCDALFGDGLVQKTGRTALLDREVEFLKTSAPVNPGSSGGPVVNLSGQVVGIVSWGRSIEVHGDLFNQQLVSWAATNFIVPAEDIQAILVEK